MYIPKDIIDLRVVPDVNGAMDINMSNNKVVNVADPMGHMMQQQNVIPIT